MKQLIQDLRNGETLLEEVPAPIVKAGYVLIKTSHSLVSLGTERMLVEFGNANLIEKARQQPDRVAQVIDKMKSDGIIPTLEAVFSKLNQPIPLGYCNVGIVIETGKGVKKLQIGDRVASNGGHAEFVCVPENLTAKIPENVSDEEATFTVIGAVGLEGIRLCNPTFGETIVVIGLGLIGQITAELLKATGCEVIAFDFDQLKVDLALAKNILAINPLNGTDPVKYVRQLTNEVGADGIIITASSKSNEIIHQAAEMSRKRGRIILTGVIGLELNRADFYEKELSFQVSCSYGPGRYDENYEQKGQDYPIGFVRWTEQRNFEAILKSISLRQLNVKSLITERVQLTDFKTIYGNMRKEGSIASILLYPFDAIKTNVVTNFNQYYKEKEAVFGIIGAGNFTSAIIIPSMKSAGAKIKIIASASGLTAKLLSKKGKIPKATSDYKEILNDNEVDTVIISTRHNLHAKFIIECLIAKKNVFVEKPLCISFDELEQIISNKNEAPDCQLVVGFNRRFAPFTQKMKQLLGEGPKNIIATMNSGFIPSNSWVHDLEVGGGRIIGEACHYIDLCTYLADSPINAVCMNSLGMEHWTNTDNVSILLKHENGSNSVINYFANGSKSYSKERIEVYYQGKTIINDNWRTLTGYGTKGFSKMKIKLDKGHKEQFRLLNESIKTGIPIIKFDEIVNTTKASFAAIQSLKEKQWIEV